MRPPKPTKANDENGLGLFESSNPGALGASRVRVALEMSLMGDPHAHDLVDIALAQSGRQVILTTRTALGGLVPDLVVTWALAEAPTLATRADDIWTVTQEALINAALHGNLGLPSRLDPTKDLWTEIDQRLTLRPHSHRLVQIILRRQGTHLDIVIQDEGDGFDPKVVDLFPPDSLALSGRGIALMARFSDGADHEDNGRRLRLRFDCPAVGDAPLGRGDLILIADDDAIVRSLLRTYLSKSGQYRFVEADDGDMALEMTRRLKPDLLVLDMRMPLLDGIEVIQILRADPEYQDLPIMAVTAEQRREERNRILRAGASRIFNKPVDGPLFAELARVMLEHGGLLRSLREYHERTHRELEIAREVQLGLLPTAERQRELADHHGCVIKSHYEACGELGGDFWGLRDLGGSRMAVYMVDFSGHGVAPALQTMRLHTFLRDARARPDDPLAVVREVNAFLVDALPVEQFATMLYGVIDFAADRLTYVGAASPPPLIGLKGREDVIRGNGDGLPLGILEDAEHDLRTLDFPPDSVLFLFSDALSETPLRPGDQPWDLTGVEHVLAGRLSRLSLRQGMEGLIHAFHARAPRALPDDLTCVWIER
jgi:sigma-B regulation protein RsbU (phosphoserine phosphatase)